MSKEMLVMVLGVWIIIVPYLGVPSSWKGIIYIISGLLIVLVGFLLRTDALRRGGKTSAHQPFVENMAGAADQYGHERKEGINSLN